MNNLKDKYVEQLRLYQSANTDAESIKSSFVIRLEEAELITETLKKKKTKSSFQHELILGRRGSGKSTLLRRIEIEIKEDVKLAKKYFPILFAEEQANIYRLSDLWFETIKEFALHLDQHLELLPFSEFNSENKYARYLFEQITKLVKKSKVYPVLLMDNFDKIISSLGENTNLLREQLLNFDSVKIIAASTRMDEYFWNYKVPFFDYFRIHNLGPLSIEEIDRLFNLWSELMNLPILESYVKKNRGKIEAIKILTDGLPRTLQFFIRILISQDIQYGFDYIKMIMDQVTPIYQERLNNLTPPQRKIFAEMAFIWESCATKDLVNACRMESKVISSQLNKLMSYGFVEKIETGIKNHLYRISERFFNMWYIVTQGNPIQKRKARYLTLFLENWYDKTEMQNLAKEHLTTLSEGTIPYKKAAVISKALSQSRYIGLSMRDRLIESTIALTNSKQINELPKKSQEIIDKAFKAVNDKDYNLAISIISEIENEEDGVKYNFLGTCYVDIKNYELAENFFLKAVDKNLFATAFYNLAILYGNQGKHGLAETYYLKAIDNGNTSALFNLGNLYNNQGEYELAENFYNKAIDNGDNYAIYNLAILYENQAKFDLAESNYLKAIAKGDSKALTKLALLYESQEKFELAQTYLQRAIDNNEPNAYNKQVMNYLESNNKQEAIKLINNNAIKLFDEISIIIDVWQDNFENVTQRLNKIVISSSNGFIELVFEKLLFLNQKHLVLKQFNDPEYGQKLKDEHIIIHYATQILTGNNSKLLELKIPKEIKGTVNEFVNEVKSKNDFYNKESDS